MKHLFLIRQFISYWWKASSAHGIHSPFVYDFIETVLKDDRHFYAFDEIQEIRKSLYHDEHILNVDDFGAGSLLGSHSKRVVKDIAKNAGRNEKFGKLLFRMVEKYECKKILELGTSLGLGTSYLAKASLNGEITTIEGSKEIANYASKTFSFLNLQHIKQVIGNFDDILPSILKDQAPFDFVFIDGNHREEPTINYFNQLLPYCSNNTILVFDDIHWSKGMQRAWDTICNHESALMTIDLFYFGLVVFRSEFKEKQHFILKY